MAPTPLQTRPPQPQVCLHPGIRIPSFECGGQLSPALRTIRPRALSLLQLSMATPSLQTAPSQPQVCHLPFAETVCKVMVKIT